MKTWNWPLIVAVGVLGVICLGLLMFVIAGCKELRGDSILGQIFIIVIRQEGGFVELVKQAILPAMVIAAIKIDFTNMHKNWPIVLSGLLALSTVFVIVFFFVFQIDSISDEVWVRDKKETFASQEAFEDAIRSFSYQTGSAIVTYGLILFGLRKKETSQ
jgi:hypothetical protein